MLTGYFNPDDLCDKLVPITEFELEGHTITTSAGIAIYPNDGLTFDELFKKADDALYQSKGQS